MKAMNQTGCKLNQHTILQYFTTKLIIRKIPIFGMYFYFWILSIENFLN
jgi:hypothetical protein